MYQLVLMVHVLAAIAIIGLVLIQHGKGADMGAAFGSGASNTVFGSQGTGGFLFKLTGFFAVVFFVTSLSLSSMVASQFKTAETQIIPQQTTVPESKIPLPIDGE
jgi:preprotein translocase subunit SecG